MEQPTALPDGRAQLRSPIRAFLPRLHAEAPAARASAIPPKPRGRGRGGQEDRPRVRFGGRAAWTEAGLQGRSESTRVLDSLSRRIPCFPARHLRSHPPARAARPPHAAGPAARAPGGTQPLLRVPWEVRVGHGMSRPQRSLTEPPQPGPCPLPTHRVPRCPLRGAPPASSWPGGCSSPGTDPAIHCGLPPRPSPQPEAPVPSWPPRAIPGSQGLPTRPVSSSSCLPSCRARPGQDQKRWDLE